MKATIRKALNLGGTENRVGLRSRRLGHPRQSNFLVEPKIPTLLPPAASDSASSKLKEKKPGSSNKTRSPVTINPTAERSTYRTQNFVRTIPATSLSSFLATGIQEQVNRRNFRAADSAIARARAIFADSARIEQAATAAFEAKARIVANLRDRKSTRLNSSHPRLSRMPSSA